MCVVENDLIIDAITILTNRQSYINILEKWSVRTNNDNTMADGKQSSNGKFDTHQTYKVIEIKKKNDRTINNSRYC